MKAKQILINGIETKYTFDGEKVVNTDNNEPLQFGYTSKGQLRVHLNHDGNDYMLYKIKLVRLYESVNDVIDYLIPDPTTKETGWVGYILHLRTQLKGKVTIWYPSKGVLPDYLMKWCGYTETMVKATDGSMTHWLDESAGNKTNYQDRRDDLLKRMDVKQLSEDLEHLDFEDLDLSEYTF